MKARIEGAAPRGIVATAYSELPSVHRLEETRGLTGMRQRAHRRHVADPGKAHSTPTLQRGTNRRAATSPSKADRRALVSGPAMTFTEGPGSENLQRACGMRENRHPAVGPVTGRPGAGLNLAQRCPMSVQGWRTHGKARKYHDPAPIKKGGVPRL